MFQPIQWLNKYLFKKLIGYMCILRVNTEVKNYNTGLEGIGQLIQEVCDHTHVSCLVSLRSQLIDMCALNFYSVFPIPHMFYDINL